MKKLVLALAAAATIAAASATSANALTILKPIGGGSPHPHFGTHFAVGFGAGIVGAGFPLLGRGCHYVYRSVPAYYSGAHVTKRYIVCD